MESSVCTLVYQLMITFKYLPSLSTALLLVAAYLRRCFCGASAHSSRAGHVYIIALDLSSCKRLGIIGGHNMSPLVLHDRDNACATPLWNSFLSSSSSNALSSSTSNKFAFAGVSLAFETLQAFNNSSISFFCVTRRLFSAVNSRLSAHALIHDASSLLH